MLREGALELLVPRIKHLCSVARGMSIGGEKLRPFPSLVELQSSESRHQRRFREAGKRRRSTPHLARRLYAPPRQVWLFYCCIELAPSSPSPPIRYASPATF